ncbi:MAG: hypothetical protein HGA90_00270 [Alphaproteobacteria bacterium]|nr:hypothetical protein [Alphaproteobacteria bacterium]
MSAFTFSRPEIKFSRPEVPTFGDRLRHNELVVEMTAEEIQVACSKVLSYANRRNRSDMIWPAFGFGVAFKAAGFLYAASFPSTDLARWLCPHGVGPALLSAMVTVPLVAAGFSVARNLICSRKMEKEADEARLMWHTGVRTKHEGGGLSALDNTAFKGRKPIRPFSVLSQG